MLWVLYVISMATLYWIYDGYGRLLRLADFVRATFTTRPLTRKTETGESAQLPSLTVLLTVHNEEQVVKQRVRNILATDYPADRIQVVVASDGSTDATNRLIGGMVDWRVRLFQTAGLGKTATQNAALQKIESEIVVFTDADTRFDRDFLRNIVAPFEDQIVGAVDGRLLYTADSNDANVRGQGYYWQHELSLRHAESRLGLLAVLTGAAFAVRRELIQPMDASIGEDCIVPLDVVLQGFRVVHQQTAKAYDSFEEGNGVTFRRRVRMTLRNWQGTWSRPALLNPFRHPGYSLALWSHKLLRWLSPVFLLVATFCSIGLCAMSPGLLSLTAVAPLATLYALAAIGWLTNERRVGIPGAGTAFSFLLVNLAFLVGVFKAITGQRIRAYSNTNSTPNPDEPMSAVASLRSAA